MCDFLFQEGKTLFSMSGGMMFHTRASGGFRNAMVLCRKLVIGLPTEGGIY